MDAAQGAFVSLEVMIKRQRTMEFLRHAAG
jgi:hypothetical protein